MLQQQCCCFLLLFVILCRMAKFVAGWWNLIPACYFSYSNSIFLNLPYGAFKVSICLHPRKLRFCGHARNQDGRQHTAAKPPLYNYIYTHKALVWWVKDLYSRRKSPTTVVIINSRTKADNTYGIGKQNRIFQHFCTLFSPGDVKKRFCSLDELLVNFREESTVVGLADVAGSICNGWPTGPVSIKNETGRIVWNRPPVSAIHPVSIKKQKIEIGPVGRPLVLRACKISQSHYVPLENWPIVHWDSRGHFLASPGEKAYERC